MRHGKNLKISTDFSKIYVVPVQMKRQRCERNTLRTELISRREGRVILFIRNGKIAEARDRTTQFRGGAFQTKKVKIM